MLDRNREMERIEGNFKNIYLTFFSAVRGDRARVKWSIYGVFEYG